MSEKQKDYVTWTIFIWAIGILLVCMGWVRYDASSSYAENKIKLDSYTLEEKNTQETLSAIRTDVSAIKTNIEWLKSKK